MDTLSIHAALDMTTKTVASYDSCGNSVLSGFESYMTNAADTTVSYVSGVSSALSSIASLGSEASSFVSSITNASTYATSCQSYLTTQMTSIQTKLPVMGAVDRIQKQAAAASGVVPGVAAGSSFTSAFAGVTHATDSLDSMTAHMEATLSSIVDKITISLPSTLTTDAEKIAYAVAKTATTTVDSVTGIATTTLDSTLASAMSSAASSIGSVVSTATSAFSCAQASESTALANGITQLKSYAFANYAAAPHVSDATSIMSKFGIPKATAATQVSSDMYSSAAAATTATTVSTDVSLKPTSAKPLEQTTYTAPSTSTSPTTTDSTKDSEYKSITEATYNICLTYKQNQLIPLRDAVIALKAKVDYDNVKKSADKITNAGGTPTTDEQAIVDKYKALKAELMATDTYKKFSATAQIYNNALPFALATQQNYSSWKYDQSKTLTQVSKTFNAPDDTETAIAAAVTTLSFTALLAPGA